jgi:5-methylcytosine-specific restriction enzyme A
MPNKPLRPCAHPGCCNLTKDGHCEKHPRKIWEKNKEVKRITGRKLQRERNRLFDDNPLCVGCQRRGIIRSATQRDHIIPLAEGGQDVPENTQGLCDECHKIKSEEERTRGIRHGR